MLGGILYSNFTFFHTGSSAVTSVYLWRGERKKKFNMKLLCLLAPPTHAQIFTFCLEFYKGPSEGSAPPPSSETRLLCVCLGLGTSIFSSFSAKKIKFSIHMSLDGV